jgi:DNA repair protein RadD
MELRNYQEDAVDAFFSFFEEKPNGSPVISIPTGGGKSLIAASIIKEVLGLASYERILVLSHVREILSQNVKELLPLIPHLPVGIYSAGLGKKSLRQVTVAGIQSIYRAKNLPPFGLVIVDEAHLVPRSGNGMYLTLLRRLREKVPGVRLVGLSATPYRLDSGLLTDGEDAIFTDVCCDISIRRLIDEGYLCPFVSKLATTQADLSGVRTRGGEFVGEDAEAAMDRDDLVRGAVDEICRYGQDRRSWLLFCAGVKHARHVCDEIRSRGITAGCVFGDTLPMERDTLIRRFKEGELRALVNVQVLCVGFNAPPTDLIALLRPTKSTGLYVQILGRGSRLSPATGKENCLVLDFVDAVRTHGCIDAVRLPRGSAGGESEGEEADDREPPAKACPRCGLLTYPASRSCLECGFEFPEPLPKHARVASTAPVMSGEREPPVVWPVGQVLYSLHSKHEKPNSLRVTYMSGHLNRISEWICFEHEGFAKKKAAAWWRKRSLVGGAVPETIAEALQRAPRELRKPEALLVNMSKKYPEIVRHVFPDVSQQPSTNGEPPASTPAEEQLTEGEKIAMEIGII